MNTEQARKHERDAIVAWLLRKDDHCQKIEAQHRDNKYFGGYLGSPSYGAAAKGIERGDHLEGQA